MDEAMQEIMRKRWEFAAACGDEINKAIPLYEDPTRYPVEELVALFRLQQEMMDAPTPEKRAELKARFSEMRRSIRLLPNAPERIYLWPEGNMPVQTEYTENPGWRNDHEPDFKPYLLEMLLPEEVTPRGAVVTIAGGSHGAGTINECYEIGLELGALGYQCFILQCRPNGCPWNEFETGADAARALRILRARADKYRIKPDNIAMAGFSNGGITIDFCIEYFSGAKRVKDYFPDYEPDALDALDGGPDAYLCVYGARHKGTPYDYTWVRYPPTFFAVGRLDSCMDNLHALYPELLARGVPMEVHTFAGHPHGYAGWKIIDGKGNPNFDLWVTHADAFLRDVFQNGNNI